MSLFADRWVQVRNETSGVHEFLLASTISRVSVWPSTVAESSHYKKWSLKESDFIVVVHRGHESLLLAITASEAEALSEAQKLMAKIDEAVR